MVGRSVPWDVRLIATESDAKQGGKRAGMARTMWEVDDASSAIIRRNPRRLP